MTKKEPENFSVNAAIESVEHLFNMLPKTKRGQALGAYNEILIVLGRIKCDDKNAEYEGK